MSSRLPVLLAVLVSTAAFLGCPASERPNILLVSLDTLRADSLGCYGYERDTTPFLDELAGRGVRFANAYVNTLATLPSHTTILSGQFQESHGVLWDSRLEEGEATRLPESIPWLPEILQAAGYTTLAYTDGGNFAARHGFDRGFDEFDGAKARGVVRGLRRLLAMLDRHADSDEPLFVLFHTYEIHAPYDPPPPYDTIFGTEPASDFVPTAERLRAMIDTAGRELSAADFRHIRLLYDGGIRFTDESLRSLFGQLAERGFFGRDYLVVVTSDHGEEFGERGGVLHRGLLYEELLRVPLILEGRRLPEGVVREDLASSVDIAPTVLDYAGVAVPSGMQGRSLLGAADERRQFVLAQFRNRRYAVRTPQWKLILSGVPELYDLTSDPGETENLAFQHYDKVEELEAIVERWRAAHEGRRAEPGEGPRLSAEELEEMRALGYVN